MSHSDATLRSGEAPSVHGRGHTAAVVLAAGLGTRMASELPKAMLDLGGRPIIEHVVDAVAAAGITRIVVVIGHRGELVRQALGDRVEYAVQERQQGTAHALACAREALGDFDGPLVTLYCDVPFVPSDLLKYLAHECDHHGAAAAMVTVKLDDPGAYGRVVRDTDGAVTGIVEAAGATPEQLAVNEINAGIYCFRAPLIFDILTEIAPDPVKGEYYLTDAIGLLVARGYRVAAVTARDPAIVMGINTPAELAQAQEIWQRRTSEGGSG